MEPQKHSVGINITKHVRKFINYQGDEITREEALGIKPTNTGKPKLNPDSLASQEGDGGEEEEKEAK